MIKTIFHFLRWYVAPNSKRIFGNETPYLCAILGISIAFIPGWLAQTIRFEIISQFVNYDFMAFGFTIAAMTIVFAVPNSRFTDYMFRMSSENPKRGVGPWEDALFLMTWNGFVHFLSLILAILVLSTSFDLSKDHTPPIYDFMAIGTRAVYGIFWIAQSYAMIQFLLTLLSISFFCASYIRDRRRDWEERSRR